MVLLPVLAMFILVVLPDLYIYLHFIQHYPLIWRILWWLPLICLSVLGICHLAGWGSPFPFRAFFLLLACVALPKLIFFLISLLGKGLGLMAPKAFQLANYLALLVAVIAFFAFAISYFSGYRLEMKKFEENKKYKNLNENGNLELGINNTISIENEEDKSKDN